MVGSLATFNKNIRRFIITIVKKKKKKVVDIDGNNIKLEKAFAEMQKYEMKTP